MGVILSGEQQPVYCTENPVRPVSAGIMINAYLSSATGNGLWLSYDEGCVWNRILNFATRMLSISGGLRFIIFAILHYRKFLRREAGFDINQGNNLWKRWEDMLKVEQIRHVLVHSEGEIEKHRAERLADIESYCKQKKGIRLIRHRIIIDEGYVAGLITELISLFELLDRQVKVFIRRYESEHGSYEVPLPQGASRIPL
ncbi:hypothetical protein [Escherichia coli]|uniref:hypothetical protein n=1 Tax=Escherichia coli TaxID=562 RepID=UPI003F885011